MSLISLSWDIWSQFRIFKDYYSNEDNLWDFVINNLQGYVTYPTKLYLEENQEEQMEYFYGIAHEVIEKIKDILISSESLKEFQQDYEKIFLSFTGRIRPKSWPILYTEMLQEFIEKT